MEKINQLMEFLKSGHIDAWVFFIVLVSEYWLGKTELVKSGSTIEVVLRSVKKVSDFIINILPKKQ